MPRFAANLTMMFSELPFAERFSAAGAAGFDAVECLFPYELPEAQLAGLLADNGLNLALFNLSPGNWQAGERGLAALPARRDEFEQSVDTALSYVRATGCRTLHMMAGNANPADEGARAAYLLALSYAADRARAEAVTITIEPINNRDMPGYFLNSFDLAIEMIAAAGRPNVKLQFDIYHRQILQGDVARGLATLLPLIGHVQIASVPERHEPASGELDDFYLFSLLDRLGYSGLVGCEYRPKAGTLAGLDWLARWQRRGDCGLADRT